MNISGFCYWLKGYLERADVESITGAQIRLIQTNLDRSIAETPSIPVPVVDPIPEPAPIPDPVITPPVDTDDTPDPIVIDNSNVGNDNTRILITAVI